MEECKDVPSSTKDLTQQLIKVNDQMVNRSKFYFTLYNYKLFNISNIHILLEIYIYTTFTKDIYIYMRSLLLTRILI